MSELKTGLGLREGGGAEGPGYPHVAWRWSGNGLCRRKSFLLDLFLHPLQSLLHAHTAPVEGIKANGVRSTDLGSQTCALSCGTGHAGQGLGSCVRPPTLNQPQKGGDVSNVHSLTSTVRVTPTPTGR